MGYWDKPYFGRVLHYFPDGYTYSDDYPICGVELKSIYTGSDQEMYDEPKCKKCQRVIKQRAEN